MADRDAKHTFATSSTTQTGTPVQPAPPVDSIPGAAPSATAAPAGPSAAAKAGTAMAAVLERLARWIFAQLGRPRTRTTAVGALLIIIGALFISHSVWTFPLVIVGIAMIIVAWVGSRLEGRFALEWSDLGAGFEMRARFKAAPEIAPPPTPPLPVSIEVDQVVEEDPVIEGEAHTVEIDVDELRALVAAADRAAAAQQPADRVTDRPSTTIAVPVSWHPTPNGSGRAEPDAE